MSNDNITEVGISDILKISKPCYTSSDIALFDSLDIMESYSVRTDMALLVVCTGGRCEIDINLRHFVAKENDLLIVLPRTLVQIKKNEGIRFFAIAASVSFMESVPSLHEKLWNRILDLWAKPVIALKPEKVTVLNDYYSLLYHKLSDDTSIYKNEIARGIAYAMLFEIGNVLATGDAIEHVKLSRKDEILKQFLALLSDNYTTSRSVAFYADKLCINPKHLTNVIKEVTGKSARDMIVNYVILEAKILLKNTNMTVNQIALHLNFPTQSFFGRYFKQYTGMSPNDYRNS